MESFPGLSDDHVIRNLEELLAVCGCETLQGLAARLENNVDIDVSISLRIHASDQETLAVESLDQDGTSIDLEFPFTILEVLYAVDEIDGEFNEWMRAEAEADHFGVSNHHVQSAAWTLWHRGLEAEEAFRVNQVHLEIRAEMRAELTRQHVDISEASDEG